MVDVVITLFIASQDKKMTSNRNFASNLSVELKTGEIIRQSWMFFPAESIIPLNVVINLTFGVKCFFFFSERWMELKLV